MVKIPCFKIRFYTFWLLAVLKAKMMKTGFALIYLVDLCRLLSVVGLSKVSITQFKNHKKRRKKDA
jgi:hypothetical protein